MDWQQGDARGQTSDQVAEVLQLVVQHSPGLCPRDVGGLLLLNHACRRALQEGVGCLEWAASFSLDRVASFAAWLPQHAGLVASLRLYMYLPSNIKARSAAEQLITFALHIASAQRTANAALAAAASQGYPQQQQQQQQPPAAAALQLRSFATNYVHSTAALTSLAACTTLTKLVLADVPPQRVTAALCASLARLQSLRWLGCSFACSDDDDAAVYPSSFAEAVAKLTRLEVLEADSRLPLSALAVLPSSLLQLRCGLDHVNSPPAEVIFSHLVNLQELECKTAGGIGCQSRMPTGLTALCVRGPVDTLPGLSQLRQLQLPDASAGLSLLQQLPDLPALQLLALGLHDCTIQQLQQVTAIIATGTQLTGLRLLHTSVERDAMEDATLALGSVQLHKCLTKLPHLHMLHVSALEVDDTDAVHFTALSKLTALTISTCPSVGDVAVGAMMMRLTGLRNLHLDCLELDSPLLWPAVACLSNLESLYYNCSPSNLTDGALHFLTPLTNLTKLTVHDAQDWEGQHSVSDEAFSRFPGSMPRLKDVVWI